MTARPRAAGAPLALFAALALCPLGCGSGAHPATVAGTVTVRDKPLVGGTVALYCADKQILHARTDADGRYSIPNVPPGAVRVTVQAQRRVPFGVRSAVRPPKLPTGDGPVPPVADPSDAPGVSVPLRYAHPEESGLIVTVAAPHVTFDIALAPN